MLFLWSQRSLYLLTSLVNKQRVQSVRPRHHRDVNVNVPRIFQFTSEFLFYCRKFFSLFDPADWKLSVCRLSLLNVSSETLTEGQGGSCSLKKITNTLFKSVKVKDIMLASLAAIKLRRRRKGLSGFHVLFKQQKKNRQKLFIQLLRSEGFTKIEEETGAEQLAAFTLHQSAELRSIISPTLRSPSHPRLIAKTHLWTTLTACFQKACSYLWSINKSENKSQTGNRCSETWQTIPPHKDVAVFKAHYFYY